MSKRKLLLADDSITIQKVVNLTFADEGIEVISVSDGDAAMIKFNESMPDLVMADVNMPGLDGYRMCEMIKQDDETKHIPVILLVGSFEPFDEQEAFRVGADDFLTKPFQSIRQLVTKVSDLLNPRAEELNIAEERQETGENTDWQFADTKELPVETLSTENLGDTGMDDEMIQTSQVNEPAQFDEVQKFISDSYSYQDDKSENASAVENSADDLMENSFNDESADDFAILEPTAEADHHDKENADELSEISTNKVYDFGNYEITPEINEVFDENNAVEINLTEKPETDEKADSLSDTVEETENVSDWQVVTVEDLQEIPVSSENVTGETDEAENSDETENSEETQDGSYEFAGVKTDSEQIEPEIVQKNKNNEPASTVEFDDFDFLELPPLVEETGIRPQPEIREVKENLKEAEPEINQKTEIEETEDTSDETAEMSGQNVAETNATAQEISVHSFPPELIEAIAQKVAERISDKTIREIAWEVVPQMTDLIVKKIAEEQLLKKARETSE